MQIKTGVDIVSVNEFEKSIKNGGQAFLIRCFNRIELNDQKVQHLSGIFAAKEAIIKALEFPADSWLTITVTSQKNGKSQANFIYLKNKIISSDISISHIKEYAVAVFTVILE